MNDEMFDSFEASPKEYTKSNCNVMKLGNSTFDEFAFILPKNDSDVEALKKEVLYELANLNKHLQDLLDLKK